MFSSRTLALYQKDEMKTPNPVFVYRKIFFEDKWHIKCIDCGPSFFHSHVPSTDFDSRELISSTGRRVCVASPDDSCETSGIPMGPSIVYGTDPTIEAAEIEVRPDLLIAQNSIVLVSDDEWSDFELPLFLSNDLRRICFAEVVMDMHITQIQDLPDVQMFNNRAANGDTDLDLLSPPASQRRSRIPCNLLFPGTLGSQSRHDSVVYSILEWKSPTKALLACFGCNAEISLEPKTVLVRHANLAGSGSSRELIAVVSESSSWVIDSSRFPQF
jgi:hypothetical protein